MSALSSIFSNIHFCSSVLIQDVQRAVDGQFDNGPAVKSHSYTKYNTWPLVRSVEAHLTLQRPVCCVRSMTFALS